ncbi:relaxin-3-like [Hemicordylus capensis]|uniref:relaxin-3-like n=1 Tax=Hemicordylus capensis TaxID=884348 RepID=UPI00230462E9|nr:relaxin-3-like [Hemicordylus capensis]
MGTKGPLLLLLLLAGAGALLLLPAELNAQSFPAAAAGAPTGRWAALSPGAGEFGVKLCGREFIRAVIFTCGGSRWKRGWSPPQPGRARAEFVQTSNDKELENMELQSFLDPELEQLQSISQPTGKQSLKDTSNLYDDYNEYVPTDNFSEYIHQVEDAAHKSQYGTGMANSLGSNNFPWVKTPRRKRDFSMGVAGMCCKWGCTKNEISTLC